MTAVKRILRYLKGTINIGIKYSPGSNVVPTICGYSDSDWAGDHDDRKSTAGFLFTINNGIISWSSKKQPTSALSTVEAEYLALTEAAKEAAWLQFFIDQATNYNISPIDVSYDNQGAGKLALNPVFHARTKHIELRHHYIREAVANHSVQLHYVPTTLNTADILTKPLPQPTFPQHRTALGLVPLPLTTANEGNDNNASNRSQSTTYGNKEESGDAEIWRKGLVAHE